MQDTLRLMIYTIIGVFGVWFIAMSIDTHLFLHSDIDPLLTGNIALNKTDIGDQCGADYENSNEPVYYKLNSENQIVYLCPLGIWPIRSTVVARTISENFRRVLRPAQLAKINAAYPPPAEQAQQPLNPVAAPDQQPAANGNPMMTPPPVTNPPVPAE